MRLAVHYQLYQKNPERYKGLTRSIFLRLEPFTNLYARVEFLQDGMVGIDLMVRDLVAGEKGVLDKEFTSIHDGSKHRIMRLDEDKALQDAIRRVEGENPFIRQSLERLQEALIEELIAG